MILPASQYFRQQTHSHLSAAYLPEHIPKKHESAASWLQALLTASEGDFFGHTGFPAYNALDSIGKLQGPFGNKLPFLLIMLSMQWQNSLRLPVLKSNFCWQGHESSTEPLLYYTDKVWVIESRLSCRSCILYQVQKMHESPRFTITSPFCSFWALS